MPITRPSHLLQMNVGDFITKANLNKLREDSKITGSEYFEDGFIINGAPQRGINWVGNPSQIRFIISKSILPKNNQYDDKYINDDYTKFKYFFQTFGNETNLNHENNIHLDQQRHNRNRYPVLLFKEMENGFQWRFEGMFDVGDTTTNVGFRKYCVLNKRITIRQ